MTGRRITLTREPAGRVGKHGRPWTLAIAALVVLAIGVLIGSRIGGDDSQATGSAPVRQTSSETRPATTPAPSNDHATVADRTEIGAAEAASVAITAFDLPVVLDERQLRSTIAEIAARAYQRPLFETYRAGAASFREKLAIGTTPEPIVFVRTTPIGFRVERFSQTEAIVAVWTVGLIGSGATVTPQQTWSTQRVSLTWESGGWKVTRFERDTGPTPPLARAEAADPPGTLFRAIPAFEPYRHAIP